MYADKHIILLDGWCGNLSIFLYAHSQVCDAQKYDLPQVNKLGGVSSPSNSFGLRFYTN